MHWLRVISWHSLVVLLCVSTLVAGTPQVHCRCSYLVNPAAAPTSCCCQPVEELETPSCCAQRATEPMPDDGSPGVSDRPCQKTLVSPEAATVERADITSAEPFGLVSMAVVTQASALVDVACRSHVPFRELPASDLQLLFQHFVI
jgi:hypothetical protein